MADHSLAHGKGSAGVHGVLLPHTEELVPRAACRGEGGISGIGREPALRGHLTERAALARTGTLRAALLRAGRDGKPHQGATQPVQRPAEYGDATRQPTAPVLLFVGLRVAARAAALGTGENGVSRRTSRNHPAALAENRRRSAHHCAAHLGALLLCLPLESALHHRLRGLEQLTQTATPSLCQRLPPPRRILSKTARKLIPNNASP